MNRLAVFLAIFSFFACRYQPAEKPSPPAETIYSLEGRILGRDPASRQITVDHKEIPDFMAAMTMPYEVRGVDVATLPADGTEITATVHVQDQTYWLTDIRAK